VYYFVISPDGSRYGPADIDTLVQWAREGRIIASTILAERGTEKQLQADSITAIAAALRGVGDPRDSAGDEAGIAIERDGGESASAGMDQEAATQTLGGHADRAPGRSRVRLDGNQSPSRQPPPPPTPPPPPLPQQQPSPGTGHGAFVGRPTPLGGAGRKSKVVAGLLGIFLGGLGVHRFYLGYTGVGVLMLLLSASCGGLTFAVAPGAGCGLVWLWGFIEGILCLCGKMRDADGRELCD